ncbi:MAG: hypothetical protein K0S32_346 [Bacteroidetes bacterium]|jgi:hypothetical protein|nr:hypothetical protein [Bacteroidota bacterium]
MKKFFPIVLLGLLSFSLFSKSGSARFTSPPGDTLDLVIGVTVTDQAAINNVRSNLQSVANAQLICFCTNLNVFIIRSSGLSYTTKEEFFTACKKANSDTPLYLKEGSVSEIVQACSYSTEDDPDKVKGILSSH